MTFVGVVCGSLRRELGFWDAVSVGLGAVIGAGIFVVVGLAAGVAGAGVVLAVVLAGFSAVFTGLSFAELGAALPRSGGVYEYGRSLLHPALGFLMGWSWVSGNIVLGATASLSFGYYLESAFPWFSHVAGAVLLIALVTLVNVVGVRVSASVNNVLVAGKVLVLLVFAALGVLSMDPGHFSGMTSASLSSLAAAAGLFYFAYIGFPRISTMAEEVVDPERNIPRAILVTLVLSMGLYVGVVVAAVGLVGSDALASSTAPIAVAAERLGIKGLVEAGALLATGSVVLTSAMGQSRVFYAMARNREIPERLARVSERFGTPVNSILLSGVIMLVLVLTVDLSGLASFTSFSVLLTHVFTNLAALRLDRRESKVDYSLRGVPVHAFIGLALSLVLSLSLGTRTLVAGGVNAALALAWFYGYRLLRGRAHGLRV
ncbi:MAG: APC family permease [Pyrobaculum sp.]